MREVIVVLCLAVALWAGAGLVAEGRAERQPPPPPPLQRIEPEPGVACYLWRDASISCVVVPRGNPL